MSITAEAVKELRQRTGAGFRDCKTTLEHCAGDLDKACEELKSKGLAIAQKKAERVTTQGVIETYVHNGRMVAAMVELNCETDFVARTDQFLKLAHDVAMQVAAMSPCYVSPQDIPEGTEVDMASACLLQQMFIKDPSKTIETLVKETIASVGENIRIRRFVRYEVGA
ncbi:MAG: elongation factor Ts [Dehalococcoidia bacterium]|nr:elongation factor Ts [Dehalococcoidia bacterium]